MSLHEEDIRQYAEHTVQGFTIPSVTENTPRGQKVYDLFSRLMEDRIVMITGEINDVVASVVTGQLLYLQNVDANKDINLYINSPGGVVTSGLSIYDTIQFIKPDVSTVCVGQAASMGAVLLAGGSKGKRHALPHSRVMIHQPSGGTGGTAADIEIHAQEILKMRETLYSILAHHIGKSADVIKKDSDRDFFLSSKEALEYGVIDTIIQSKK